MSFSISEVKEASEIEAFIDVPWQIYGKETQWVPPLRMAVKEQLDPKKHPFYRHADHAFFLVEDGKGKALGRIAVFIDQDFNHYQKENAALFGFFECVNDQDVSNALFEAAEAWAASKGASKLQGPFNLNTNYETGLLVDGFDEPPSVGMTYALPFYEDLILSSGFKAFKNLFAYYFYQKELKIPEKIVRHFQLLKKRYNVKVRKLNLAKFEEEVRMAFDLYNSAWEENWGFVPVDEEEFKFIAGEMKKIIDPEIVYFAEIDGKAVGFSLAVPDVNLVFQKLGNGKLFPFGFFKLLWGLKGPNWHKKLNRLRIIALGVHKKYEHLGIGALLYYTYMTDAVERGYTQGECSWVLEENELMTRSLQMMGAKREKTYRLFEKPIGSDVQSSARVS